MTAKIPEHICTDPNDPKFFEGVPDDQKLRVLRKTHRKAYKAIMILLNMTLRDVFAAIGPDPKQYRVKDGL